MIRMFVSASVLALAAAALPASAAFVTPQSWERGVDGTYQEWDVFNSMADATPDVANINSNGIATLTENSGNAFIASSGNIYGGGGATDFTVTIPETEVTSPPHDVTAIVQIRTQGAELDLSSVLLNDIAAVDSAELSRTTLGGFGGAMVDTWFLFNIPYASFGDGQTPTDLTLTFAASDAHMSLDALAIDTAIRPFGYYSEVTPAPEPGSLALMGLSGLALLRRRRNA